MNRITYNVPSELVRKYTDLQIIVRSHDPAEIVGTLSSLAGLDNVQFVQLLSADVSPEALETLARWDCSLPLDIVVRNPIAEYPLLYNFAKIARSRPIRVSITAEPGFKKAVKLALALHFAVKLVVGQPDHSVVEELSEVLDLYLHRPDVSHPVEYFQSVFLSFYRQEETNLWQIQEEDPAHFRFIDNNGVEQLSTRFAGLAPENLDTSLQQSARGSRYSLPECESCQYSHVCRGFFKWTDSAYDCHGVKSLFTALESAAAELREDVRGLSATQKGGAL